MTDDHSWWAMLDAPRDGTPIRVQVGKGFGRHEFPHTVLWHEGRWCFQTTRAPLFPWQRPTRWRPA